MRRSATPPRRRRCSSRRWPAWVASRRRAQGSGRGAGFAWRSRPGARGGRAGGGTAGGRGARGVRGDGGRGAGTGTRCGFAEAATVLAAARGAGPFGPTAGVGDRGAGSGRGPTRHRRVPGADPTRRQAHSRRDPPALPRPRRRARLAGRGGAHPAGAGARRPGRALGLRARGRRAARRGVRARGRRRRGATGRRGDAGCLGRAMGAGGEADR